MFLTHIFKKSWKSHGTRQNRSDSQIIDDSTLLSQGFHITHKIGESNASVYQISTVANHKLFVMKEFPYKDNKSDPYYENEARFIGLKHPNIINMICKNDRQECPQSDSAITKMSSYIIMEYAPYGDFVNLITKYGQYFNEKLIRTYFRQLIEGIEYLQLHHVAHLDLKPENLLLGADFNLKIADFDVSYFDYDKKILSDGTQSYRCPEIYKVCLGRQNFNSPFAADIYSAGILLFILKSGVNPYLEDATVQGVDFLKLMNQNNAEFWKKHCELEKKSDQFYDNHFIQLFNGMTRANPEQRFTIKEIKKSKWYNGPVYSKSKLQKKMREIFSMR